MAYSGKELTDAFAAMSASAAQAVDAFKALGDAIGQLSLPEGVMKLKSDATTWVMRDENGRMARIAVTDMTDPHLYRWIRYFRKKYRDDGFTGSDAAIDARIRMGIVTAPAIYAEAQKRGVYSPPAEPVAPATKTGQPPLPVTAAPQWFQAAGKQATDPLEAWVNAVKRDRPQFYETVLSKAESVEVGDRFVTVTFASAVLRDAFEQTRPLLDRLASQAWRGPMSVRGATVTAVAAAATFPFKVKRADNKPVTVEPGARRITLEDEP